MSATGRAGVRESRDFYRTPGWCVTRLLDAMPRDEPEYVLDPGCGDGAIGAALRVIMDCPIYGVELDPDLREAAAHCGAYNYVQRADFLTELPPPADCRTPLIVANPPYKHALDFVQRALYFAGEEGTVAFLLRLAWLAGQKRATFHRAHPSDIYVLSKRPSFTGNGTDATDYAWFVWGPGPRGRVVVL